MALGNLVRLIPLKLNEVPSHPLIESYLASSPRSKHPPSSSSSDEPLSSTSTTLDPDGRPLLAPFLIAVLTEATTFVDDTLPVTFRPKSTKSNPPATAPIDVVQRMISAEEISKIPFTEANVPRKSSRARQSYGEAWFARKSTHLNRRERGTADYREFEEGLRRDHSHHEMEYTPDVFDAYKVLDWDAEIQGLGGGVEGFQDVSMSGMCWMLAILLVNRMILSSWFSTVYEMCHKLPFPLAPRVFPVLVVHALTGQDGFVVVQVPINLKALSVSFYSSRVNEKQGDSAVKRKVPVFG
jgi:hypothetical protein